MSQSCVEKGIITYIYLKHFITYNEVVVKPRSNLNLIIGPNGTGKSTIVCAIILGLGGKLSTIGRAMHLAEYVKAGCEEAKIEIHLRSGKNTDVIVTRVFNIQGKSAWFLDNKPCNTKAVQELTNSLNIQIDNLCQFLPQDKVQDFSKMDAQQLLESTERSVGDPVLLEYHKKLINYRSEHKSLQTQIINKNKLLQTKTQMHDGLKEIVSGIKQRKLIKKKIISLKQKQAWMLYDEMRRELLKLKKKKEAASAEMTSLETEMKPINNDIEKLKSEITLLRNSVNDHENKVAVKNNKLKNMMETILDCEHKIKECENACKRDIQTEQSRDHEIEIVQQQKSKLEDDLSFTVQDVGSEEASTKLRQQALAKIEKQRSIITSLKDQNAALKQQEDRLTNNIETQETELQYNSDETKRLQVLCERSSDTYKAVRWLRDNLDKFSGPIHEPMLLNINVKDPSCAKYVENIIPFRDLIAFICENKQDMNLLLGYLRDEQHLQVNVVHCDPSKYVPMHPKIPIESIRRFGFTHYLVSLIEAPATIMKYLVSMYNLNNIPIGSQSVEDNIDAIPNSLNCYFSENYLYGVRISKYTGEKSTRIQAVSGAGLFTSLVDKSKLRKIEENIKVLREEKNSILTAIKEIEEKICEQDKELEKYRADRNKYQQNIHQIQVLKSRIGMAEKKIKELENERTSVQQIQESYSKKIKIILGEQFEIYKRHNSEMEQLFKCVTDTEKIKITMKLRNRLLRTKINESQDLREQLEAAERKLLQIADEMQPLKSRVQRKYDEALQTTDNINPSDSAFAPINNSFKKLPATLDEIAKALSLAEAKEFCMGNNKDGENALREYEALAEDIKNLTVFIEEKTVELNTTMKEMEKLREQWLSPLREIIERINANFSSYFSEMGCAGEVALSHGENLMDFDQYGLIIRVKFRDTDQLQVLTRHHQSGGERAVTTALYLISLQELSRVPFRCIDEINQGMDAINERRVFNLLVKMTARPNSSQCFLLTPKLLPGLEYDDTVTVHCIFNGPFMIRHTEFDMDDYIKHVVRTTQNETVNDD